ncbi:hypothetical protein BB561_004566 [Smittium simulii]|uniref:Uncharacterized protein n=1 Tax=Smittium simulii TaxID=133385 RepID=A0A2T9YFM8_9FUNG|nr:hypothetical protein BB561_004566 [Smittium simulii]
MVKVVFCEHRPLGNKFRSLLSCDICKNQLDAKLTSAPFNIQILKKQLREKVATVLKRQSALMKISPKTQVNTMSKSTIKSRKSAAVDADDRLTVNYYQCPRCGKEHVAWDSHISHFLKC